VHVRSPYMMPHARRPASRGFTLVELMVVVVIVGILGVIGISSFRSRVFGSKPVQALAMIQSIRAAEERWKGDNLTYLDVTRTAAWYPAMPAGRVKHAFYNSGTCGLPIPDTDDCRWKLLNPTSIGPVEFGFKVNAGPPSQPMTPPDSLATLTGFPGWPPNPDHWYVIQAIADGNGDGKYSKFIASSIRSDVGRENEGD
jgi:prepilin-type N-terminal cleavage/methylation domain-containing protein